MTLPANRFAVVTGAPGAGKTALLEQAHRGGITTSPEVARLLLRQPGGMALRNDDPLGFAEAMTEAHEHEFARFAGHDGPVLFDRGLPDVVGFLEASGLSVPPTIDRACRTLRYGGQIFRAPAWAGIYRQDSERIQDWQQAVASDHAVSAAWRRYGYDLLDLPLVPVGERLAFVRERL